jgi:iron complex outermembrane receptor protein
VERRFVIQPVAQFSFSMDWYNIKISDIISTPGAQEVVTGFVNGDPAYANSVVLNSSGQIQTISTQTVNAGVAETDGFDVMLDTRTRSRGAGSAPTCRAPTSTSSTR